MNHGSRGGSLRLGAGFAILLVAAACTESGPTTSADLVDEALLTSSFAFTGANVQIGSGASADGELFEVCKRWEGTSATANFTVDDGGGATAFTDATFLGPFSDGGPAGGHNDWMCADVWIDGGPANVTVMETGVTGGSNPYVTTVQAFGVGAANVQVNGTTVSGNIQGAGGASGIVAFYTNTEEIPPPMGNNGCTPGYWKQSQHFDSWMDYAPSDDFDGTFGVAAVPLVRPETGTTAGMTLLEGLGLRGGGVNALIRHAVAGLLNADQGFYPLTEAEVIADFQAAVGGGDIEGTKNAFATNNELGCPLN